MSESSTNYVNRYLKSRKKLLKKLCKTISTVYNIETQLRFMDEDFKHCTVDINKYKRYLKKHYIEMDDGSKYIPTDIRMFNNNTEHFYEVVYTYIDAFNPKLNSFNNTMSLRKFMHFDYSLFKKRDF